MQLASSLGCVASIALCSNYFQLLIANVDSYPGRNKTFHLDPLSEEIDLGNQFLFDSKIPADSYFQGINIISRFSSILKSRHISNLRAVASSSLCAAENFKSFVKDAEDALGHQIQVIPGIEESLLIYSGVLGNIEPSSGRSLVLAIGNFSTEIIIGDSKSPSLMESLYMGSTSYGKQFFPSGYIDSHSFKEAESSARAEIRAITDSLKIESWDISIGASKLIREISVILNSNNLNHPIYTNIGTNRSGGRNLICRHRLAALKERLIKSKHTNQISLVGYDSNINTALPATIAILIAIFDELDILVMEVADISLGVGMIREQLNFHQSP